MQMSKESFAVTAMETMDEYGLKEASYWSSQYDKYMEGCRDGSMHNLTLSILSAQEEDKNIYMFRAVTEPPFTGTHEKTLIGWHVRRPVYVTDSPNIAEDIAAYNSDDCFIVYWSNVRGEKSYIICKQKSNDPTFISGTFDIILGRIGFKEFSSNGVFVSDTIFKFSIFKGKLRAMLDQE